MTAQILDPAEVARLRALRDLTDPAQGLHAMQIVIERIRAALTALWECPAIVHRADPVISIEDNYDRLGYPPDGAARDARYTRYASERTLLRTSTSAMIPSLLRLLAEHAPADVLLLCPGLVYRRDTIDRLHTGEPHQLDVWRIARARLDTATLREMIEAVVATVLPGAPHRCTEASHPYTTHGLQVDVLAGGEWVEIGECGLAHPALLRDAGLDTDIYSGLAMGLGLDRILMLAKGVDDIRLLRSRDARIAAQMLDLTPYRPVSSQPPVKRDLSIAVDADATPEEIGDRVRGALGERVRSLESLDVLSETRCDALPRAALERIGMRPGQKNVLVRLVIRDPERTLTSEEANELRDDVYAALHEGDVWVWAGKRSGAKT